MRRLFLFGWLLLACLALSASTVFAQTPSPADSQTYVRGRILEVLSDKQQTDSPLDDAEQVVLVEPLSGAHDGETLTVTYTFSSANYRDYKLRKGDVVVLGQVTDVRGENYYILDRFRLPSIIVFLTLFAAIAVFFGRSQGAGSLAGLAASLVALMMFVVPRILAGDNPVTVSLLGASVIAIVSILLAHGFKRRTYVALVATLTVLVVAVVLAILAAHFAGLSGTGTEEAVFLQLSYLPNLDLRGLLLGGVIIGTLGVLDDVTTAQVAAIEEISLANPALGVAELYQRGLSVGREHIAALVNTLALAYAGASFPLFLLFALPDRPPLWVIMNNENIIEEVLRALVGGTSLMLAVPIATVLAASVFGSVPRSERQVASSLHHH